MKDYVPKKPKDFQLERSLYLRVLNTVRDYPRIKQQINDAMFASVTSDGMPHGTDIGKPTEKKAIIISELQKTVNAIDKALAKIPKEYQKPVFNNIVYRQKYPYTANRNTWSLWRVRFIYFVAIELNWI